MKSHVHRLGVTVCLTLFALGFTLVQDASKVTKGAVSIKGKDCKYVAYIPDSYQKDKPNPVIFLAHGNGDTAENFLRSFISKGGNLGDILVISLQNTNSRDHGFIPLYVEALKKQFMLDEKKMGFIGFSSGGFHGWFDVFVKPEQHTLFKAMVFIGCIHEKNALPPKKADGSPALFFCGDPHEANCRGMDTVIQKIKDLGYIPEVIEHHEGHHYTGAHAKKMEAWIRHEIKE